MVQKTQLLHPPSEMHFKQSSVSTLWLNCVESPIRSCAAPVVSLSDSTVAAAISIMLQGTESPCWFLFLFLINCPGPSRSLGAYYLHAVQLVERNDNQTHHTRFVCVMQFYVQICKSFKLVEFFQHKPEHFNIQASIESICIFCYQ